MPNGDYQSCITCESFVTCSGGYIKHRSCPANFMWDDDDKRCGSESKTCNIPSAIYPSTVEPISVPSKCVSDCSDVPYGNYQSCETCEDYVTCSNGSLYVQHCPAHEVWNDVSKCCEWESPTCNISSAIHRSSAYLTSLDNKCVSDCSGLPDGDYPSCKTSKAYVICSNGRYFDQPCPPNHVWHDEKKRCIMGCVSDCKDMPDGEYESCTTCEGYVVCQYGHYYELLCPPNHVWNDEKKSCEFKSSTPISCRLATQ